MSDEDSYDDGSGSSSGEENQTAEPGPDVAAAPVAAAAESPPAAEAGLADGIDDMASLLSTFHKQVAEVSAEAEPAAGGEPIVIQDDGDAPAGTTAEPMDPKDEAPQDLPVKATEENQKVTFVPAPSPSGPNLICLIIVFADPCMNELPFGCFHI